MIVKTSFRNEGQEEQYDLYDNLQHMIKFLCSEKNLYSEKPIKNKLDNNLFKILERDQKYMPENLKSKIDISELENKKYNSDV